MDLPCIVREMIGQVCRLPSRGDLKSSAPTKLPYDSDGVGVGSGLRVNTSAAIEFDRVVLVDRKGASKAHPCVLVTFAFIPVDGRAPAGIVEPIEPHP